MCYKQLVIRANKKIIELELEFPRIRNTPRILPRNYAYCFGTGTANWRILHEHRSKAARNLDDRFYDAFDTEKKKVHGVEDVNHAIFVYTAVRPYGLPTNKPAYSCVCVYASEVFKLY